MPVSAPRPTAQASKQCGVWAVMLRTCLVFSVWEERTRGRHFVFDPECLGTSDTSFMSVPTNEMELARIAIRRICDGGHVIQGAPAATVKPRSGPLCPQSAEPCSSAERTARASHCLECATGSLTVSTAVMKSSAKKVGGPCPGSPRRSKGGHSNTFYYRGLCLLVQIPSTPCTYNSMISCPLRGLCIHPSIHPFTQPSNIHSPVT